MALPRLIFITGKGGTGKSTVAAALALALARHRPTTLADLDQRLSAARLLKPGADGSGASTLGPNLDLRALSPRNELEDFIERIVPVKAISRRMLQSRTFGYVTAALPGLEAFLMLERLKLLAGEAALHDRYLVVDGPATGTALELLSVADGVGTIAPRGTLNRLAEDLKAFLGDPERFGVLLTLVPEELAIREALEAAAVLAKRPGVQPLAAVLNSVADPLFTPAELKTLSPLGDGHARLAARRRDMNTAAAGARLKLEAAGLSLIELPMLFRPALGTAEISKLSERLERKLLNR